MPKLQIEATALKHTDVNFVSLVKHGANRIPFRIMKEDSEPMLDLGKISRTLFKKADIAPSIVAVMVSKSADQAKASKALAAAGLVMTQKAEQGDAVVYAQPDVQAGDRDGVYRLNSDVALVVSGLADLPSRVQKDFCSYDGTSTAFLSVLNTEGFYPSMYMASSALTDTISNIMDAATSPSDAETMISAAIDDFKSYILPCIAGIPVRAFKADVALRKSVDVVIVGVETTDTTTKTLDALKPGNQTLPSNSGIGDGANPNGTGYDPAEDRVRATKAEAPIGTDVKPEPSPVNADQGRTTTNGTPSGESPIGVDTTKEPNTGVNQSQDPGRPTNVGGGKVMPMTGEAPVGVDTKPETSPVNADQGRGDVAIAGLMKGFEDVLTAQIGSFRNEVLASLSKTDKRIDGIEGRIKKTEEAVNGTALGDAAGDQEREVRTTKSEGPPPLLDTGYRRQAA